MQVRVKAGQTISEPITVSEVKNFMGYSASDQDGLISTLITAAREFLESETGLSGVSKSYEVEFDRWDMISEDLSRVGYSGYDDGWFRLPFSPVTSITTVEMNGVTTTYSQKGLKIVYIHPDTVIQTGTTANTLQCEFVAGESNVQFKNAMLRIVSDMFNHREDNVSSVSMASIGFDTRRMINNLSVNIAL